MSLNVLSIDACSVPNFWIAPVIPEAAKIMLLIFSLLSFSVTNLKNVETPDSIETLSNSSMKIMIPSLFSFLTLS